MILQKRRIESRAVCRQIAPASRENKGVFKRKKGTLGEDLEVHCKTEGIARTKYLCMKIGHLLFPNKIPNPVGVSGSTLYTHYVKPHAELKREMEERVQKGMVSERTRNSVNARYRQEVQKVGPLIIAMSQAGIDMDAHVTNMAFTKKGVVFYDPISVTPERVLAAAQKMGLGKEKLRALEHFLRQYRELKAT